MDAPLNLAYDRKSDVLYMHFGDPRPAVSEEVDPGVLVRRDIDTGDVVGVTLIGFARQGRWLIPDLQAPDRAA